ncbi:MAG: DNA-methyltransferase [Planctomycetota bacterium]|jgi:site-specific DNA-methyltransferase (adenine-specific)
MMPYYERNGITIYVGDCLEVMPQLSPPFDAIISDWPYGTTACEWDSVIPLEPLWAECKRLVKKAGAVVLTASQPFTSRLVTSNLEWFRVEWIWEKPAGTNYLNANRDPMKNHESIIVFANGYPTYNPQMRDGKPYAATSGSVGGFIRDKTVGGYTTVNNGERYPVTVNKFNLPKIKLHPTQKPLSLMSYLLKTYTAPSDLILDNAFGSGTTLVAAQNEGRRCVGIEISEDWCKTAVERLRQPSFFSLPTQSDNGAATKHKQPSLL